MKNEIKYHELTYHFKSENRKAINFNDVNRQLGLIRKIRDGSIDLEKAKEYEEKFGLNLRKTTRGKWYHKPEEQKKYNK